MRMTNTPPRYLSFTEERVLQSLYDKTGACAPPEWYIYFRTIEADTKLDRKTVRAACRSLRKRGMAEYRRGLLDEDCRPCGAGYACTLRGGEYVREILDQRVRLHA